jgi:hypothetical protein
MGNGKDTHRKKKNPSHKPMRDLPVLECQALSQSDFRLGFRL